MLPTIQGSGGTSSAPAATTAAAGSDEWLPTETTVEVPSEQPTGGTGSGPRIVFESSEGHTMALDADDLMLVIMAVLLTIELRRAV